MPVVSYSYTTQAELEALPMVDRLTLADRMYEGLGSLLTVAGGQQTNALLAEDKNFADHFTPAGKLTKRSAGGSTTTKKVKTVTVDAMAGADQYLRPNGQAYFTRKWGEHDDVEVLRKSRAASHYVLLYGAPGCGKTALAEAAFGEELETVLGSGDTEVSDLVGGYVQTPSGGFEWVDGPLIRAAEAGKPLLIDEVGLIDPKVLSIIYGLMDGRKEYTVTANPERGTVKAKDGFYVLSATNPNAPGVRLSEALLSRFSIHAEMTTDWSLAKKLGAPTAIVTCAQNLAKKQASGEVSWAPQMRELLAFRDLSNDFGTPFAIANLLAAAPEMDRPVVADVFTRVFGEECRPAKI
jgi:nitric oxide reductase NorQ protein